MRFVTLLFVAAVLGSCGITDAESDLEIELRGWRVITNTGSQSWLEVLEAVKRP